MKPVTTKSDIQTFIENVKHNEQSQTKVKGPLLRSKYALFKGNVRMTKAHSTRFAVGVEAHEKGLVLNYHADYPDDPHYTGLTDGYQIREVEEE